MVDQQRAREQFETWCNGRYRLDKRINVIGDVVYADRWIQGAFVGFTAALRAAPEGFVMVPVEPTAAMLQHMLGYDWRADEARLAYGSVLAARPRTDDAT